MPIKNRCRSFAMIGCASALVQPFVCKPDIFVQSVRLPEFFVVSDAGATNQANCERR